MGAKKNSNPTLLFIFGGSGDLTNRKLIPALYNLYIDNYLPEKFFVIGVGRTTFASHDEYRNKLLEGVQQFSRRKGEANEHWKKFSENILYFERICLTIILIQVSSAGSTTRPANGMQNQPLSFTSPWRHNLRREYHRNWQSRRYVPIRRARDLFLKSHLDMI
jgi:hypothetical protein